MLGGGERRWEGGGAKEDDACEGVSATFRLVLLELFFAVEMAWVDVEVATEVATEVEVEVEVEEGVASTAKLFMQNRVSIHYAWNRTLKFRSIAAAVQAWATC